MFPSPLRQMTICLRSRIEPSDFYELGLLFTYLNFAAPSGKVVPLFDAACTQGAHTSTETRKTGTRS